MKSIPYGRQSISQEDIAAVVEVLQSDWLTTGPAVDAFEAAVSAYCGVCHAVAVNSATSALHIACMALGLQKGEVLWTTPNTFVASANCALYCGADVDFVDIDPQTYNMSVTALRQKLEAAKKQGRLPKVLVPVHFSGQPCEMRKIAALAKEYGFAVIEDASHAIGSSYEDSRIGDCQYSDMTVFSFHPVKIVTTAEGGMVTTQAPELAERLRMYRSHGITRDSAKMTEASHGDWYYQQIDLGYNYRITDLQCALGTSQMKRIDNFLARRREIAAIYDRELQGLPVLLPKQQENVQSAWHLYVIQIDESKADKNRKEVFDFLRSKGIGVNVHYIPVHTQPYYQQHFGFKPGDFPVSEEYYCKAISLPMYAELSQEQQQQVISAVKEAVAR
ncbi:UDP-4-amino-4,6-dideoxy-N-acetyl-beta-L-altrosamine transaminase [Anaeromusa acidaminophila]|uniref:UDP-4-amino-4, 6-dideoxy-N-acetyl-beta-L-altrosamine transaminase n=1 Tax=Anaeromusa acidaminophila TaxID=81464 RepID=UPI0003785DA7|nr:UDP-4-amino-4,6-dideoxy-N-acetyl-beta-L-altrosamine transaminase [Anaeromusa acidaminophila]